MTRGQGASTSEVMQIFNQPFSFSKLLVAVLVLVSVEGLVSVEDAPSTRFARYGIKMIIITCLGFQVLWKIDLIESRLEKNTSNS